jgi:TRAP-type C4-dicarboxylate transport system substrate-binding protein
LKLTLRACIATAIAVLPLAGLAQTKWDMATPFPETNYHTRNARAFVEEVLKESGGQLVITMHSNASLMKMPEIKRAVSGGQVQMGDILLAAYGNEDPFFEIDGIPFTVQGFDGAKRLYDATKPFLNQRLAKQGLIPLHYVVWPGQALYSKAPLNSLADFKGLRFRTYSPTTSRFAELLGSTPTTVQAPEIPMAFATGLASVMITSGSTGVDTMAWDYSKYFYDIRAMHNKSVTIVNEKAFKSLSPALQKVVMNASARAETRGWAMAATSGDETAAILKSKGMLVEPGSPALVNGLREIGAKLTDEWVKRAGPEGEQALKALRK